MKMKRLFIWLKDPDLDEDEVIELKHSAFAGVLMTLTPFIKEWIIINNQLVIKTRKFPEKWLNSIRKELNECDVVDTTQIMS